VDSTKSYVTVYNISPQAAHDFEFYYDTEGIESGRSDILTELVPQLNFWDDIGWIEVEEYEYNQQNQTINLTLETKWAPPLTWLREASHNVCFQNKLITMTTIQKDETLVTGIAAMDGEILQKKPIFEMSLEDVAKYYNDDEPGHDLDELDNDIWNSIDKFVNICEQFYLEREEEND
jgi:hypothetical protein